MPVLEQREDGGYYIRAYSHSKGCFITWQVSGPGYTFLNKQGIYEGNKFSLSVLQSMVNSNLVSTAGSGIHSGNAGNQNGSVIATSAPAKKLSLMNNSIQTIRPKSFQKSKSQTQKAAPQYMSIERKTTSLVFRKYKKRWELLIAFPKLSHDVSERLSASGCSLTVDSAINILKAKQLQNNNAFLAVMPQDVHYGIRLVGSCSSHTNLWSLFMDLKNSSISEVNGLNLSGTVFEKNREALPLKEGLPLGRLEPLSMGNSYYLVFHKAYKPTSVPHTIRF